MSWSEALASSLNFWGLLEGTHVLSLMLFAGTIFVVDLRLLGLTFKRTPVAVISLMSWLLVITFGRFIAYDWTDCGKALPHWINVAEECVTSEHGALDLKDAPK